MSPTHLSQPQAPRSGWERKARLELAVTIVQEIRDGVQGETQRHAAPRPEMEGIRSPKEGHTKGAAPLVKISASSPTRHGRAAGNKIWTTHRTPRRALINTKERER